MEITQEDIIKNYREVNAEQDYKIRMLEAENQRLKAQLDREIHINRIMKRVLEIYANTEPIEIMQQRWDEKPTTLGKTMLDIRKPAQDTLRQIEEME